MQIKKFLKELKRRNVFRVATAYAIAAWLIIQIVTVIEEPLSIPDWFDTIVIIMVAIGFPVALIFAWAFELTPEGIKKSDEVEITDSVVQNTGRKLNVLIIATLSILVLILVVDRLFIESNMSDSVPVAAATISMQSVAVLPFADLSENGDQDWFSDGLTEEILNSLAQLPELKVTSRTSAFQFKGRDIDISKIADTLKVANVVEGSVRRIGDRLRVTAQLIRAADGFHLWSETYDSNTENLFDVQSSIAEEIATTLNIYLDDNRRESMFATGTRNVEAFQLYLKGMETYREAHSSSIIDKLWEANAYFDEALAIDPGYGIASVIKMDAYAHLLVDPGTSTQNMTLDEARAGMIEVLKYGAENINDPAQQAAIKLNVVFFSDSWFQLRGVVNELKNEMKDDRMFPPGNNWAVEIFSLFGENEIVKRDVDWDVETNPLNLTTWIYKISETYKRVGLAATKEVVTESRKTLGNNELIEKFEHFLIALEGDEEQLREAYPDGLNDWGYNDPYMLTFNAFFAASLNNAELANTLYNRYKSLTPFVDDLMVLTLFKLGKTEEAKAQIRFIDSLPAGPANLSLSIATLGNTLFFNLEDAPNTAARFREAGIDISIFKKAAWVN
jgi:TolB-like protein